MIRIYLGGSSKYGCILSTASAPCSSYVAFALEELHRYSN